MCCGSSIYRGNSEWHLFDIRGAAGVIADGSANVLSSNLYDSFGTEMYASGSAATQWRFVGRFVEEEGLVAAAGGGGDVLVARGLELKPPPPPAKKKPKPCTDQQTYYECLACCAERRTAELGHCTRQLAACMKAAHTVAAQKACMHQYLGCELAADGREELCFFDCKQRWNPIYA